jgi:hypothetical protein
MNLAIVNLNINNAKESVVYQDISSDTLPLSCIIESLFLEKECSFRIIRKTNASSDTFIYEKCTKNTSNTQNEYIEVVLNMPMYFPSFLSKNSEFYLITEPPTKCFIRYKLLNFYDNEKNKDLIRKYAKFWDNFWNDRQLVEIHDKYYGKYFRGSSFPVETWCKEEGAKRRFDYRTNVKYIHLDTEQTFDKITLIIDRNVKATYSGSLCKFLARKKSLNGYVISFDESNPPFFNFSKFDCIQIELDKEPVSDFQVFVKDVYENTSQEFRQLLKCEIGSS